MVSRVTIKFKNLLSLGNHREIVRAEGSNWKGYRTVFAVKITNWIVGPGIACRNRTFNSFCPNLNLVLTEEFSLCPNKFLVLPADSKPNWITNIKAIKPLSHMTQGKNHFVALYFH